MKIIRRLDWKKRWQPIKKHYPWWKQDAYLIWAGRRRVAAQRGAYPGRPASPPGVAAGGRKVAGGLIILIWSASEPNETCDGSAIHKRRSTVRRGAPGGRGRRQNDRRLILGPTFKRNGASSQVLNHLKPSRHHEKREPHFYGKHSFFLVAYEGIFPNLFEIDFSPFCYRKKRTLKTLKFLKYLGGGYLRRILWIFVIH